MARRIERTWFEGSAGDRLNARLVDRVVGVRRFDFTGLGNSEGELANTNCSSNVEDLVRAADMLRHCHAAPTVFVGHSFGGAAVLAADSRIPEAVAVATIDPPFDAAQVTHLLPLDAVAELPARTPRIRCTQVSTGGS